MDLEQYRQAHGLTYVELADKLGLPGHSSAWRIAQGVAWPADPERLEAIVTATGGEVTLDAMHKRRLRRLRDRRMLAPAAE